MSGDGLSRRKRRRAERDRAFTEPVPQPAHTRSMPRTPDAAPTEEQDPSDTVHSGRDTARAAGRGVVRGAGAMARFTATASKKTVRVARRASEAQGAGESGLARLIQVHAFNSAGDATVTIGLAGTVFFSVSSSQAKGQVLLFLCLTMLPFTIVAPLLGPLLDRFRHGRRWAIGFTLAIRAFLCWVLAEAVDDNSVWLFPVALCVLVASRAYLVTRSSAAPRLLPPQLTLVKANGRLSLAGVIGAGMAGALAGGAAKIGGASWALRVGALLFAIGTVLAILLPPRVDSSVGEKPAPSGLTTGKAAGRGVGPAVVTALRANTGLRWLSGFLTIFLAFLVRTHPFPGWEGKETLLLALVLGAAGVGNSVGTVTGAVLKIASPKTIVLATLIADAVMVVVAAAHFTIVTAVAVGFVAGLSQQLGKLALDSQIQDTVPEHMRTSVFGRSETLLQLAWVIGGIIAVVIPTNASLGMVLAAIVLVAWATVVLIWNSGHSLPVPRPRAARSRPPASPPESHTGSDEAETIGVRRSDVARHRPPRPSREERPGGWR